jgi:hypothetical protein
MRNRGWQLEVGGVVALAVATFPLAHGFTCSLANLEGTWEDLVYQKVGLSTMVGGRLIEVQVFRSAFSYSHCHFAVKIGTG